MTFLDYVTVFLVCFTFSAGISLLLGGGRR